MEGDYSFADIEERATKAFRVQRDFSQELLAKYAERSLWRFKENVPVLAVLGVGRAGKDTAARYICSRAELDYGGSSSNNLLYYVADMVGLPREQAWQERHQHRGFWIEAGHAVRRVSGDLTFFAKLILGSGDLIVGLRGDLEVYACFQSGLAELSLWIDNPRVPADVTTEFGADDCDVMVPNHGSKFDLYRKLDRLVAVVYRDRLTSLAKRAANGKEEPTPWTIGPAAETAPA